MSDLQAECRLRRPGAGVEPTPATSTISPFADRGRRRAAIRLAIAALLCAVLMVVTFVGGLLARSLALVAQSIHVFGDLCTILLNLLALYIGAIGPNKWLTFGWLRAEILGALATVVIIWAGGILLITLAVLLIIRGVYNVDSTMMLIIAIIGIIIDLAKCFVLYQGKHAHAHLIKGGSSDEEGAEAIARAEYQTLDESGRKEKDAAGKESDYVSINVFASFIHSLSDLFVMVGVLIAAIIIMIRPDWMIVDPIVTILFVIPMFILSLPVAADVLLAIMEGRPRWIRFDAVKTLLLEQAGVVGVHNLRIWSLSASAGVASAHLEVKAGTDAQVVIKSATAALRQHFKIEECALQVEVV